MQINSRDQWCRYLAANGPVEGLSPFVRWLNDYGVTLPQDCSLATLVNSGWVRPALRVVLPRSVFDAWHDYPYIPSDASLTFPEDDHWAIQLYLDVLNGARAGRGQKWWTHFLDDPTDPVAGAARAHAISSLDPAVLPKPFNHGKSNRLIHPWLDFFAYWQVFPIVEILDALSLTVLVHDNSAAELKGRIPLVAGFANLRIRSIVARWEKRRTAFEWLSRVRTVFGSSIAIDRRWSDVDGALANITRELGETADGIRLHVRETLLTIWAEWARDSSQLRCLYPKLRGLLRQEIQYALAALEALTAEPTDFFADYWHDPRQRHPWANLIDALPIEEELARRDFPAHAMMYLAGNVAEISACARLDERELSKLLSRHWDNCRPLRRFVLSFDRLHRELAGEKLMASESVIHASEKIEQLLLTVFNAERVLSQAYRARKRSGRYEVRNLAKDSLNHVLNRLGLHGRGIGANALKRAAELLKDRAMLHDLDQLKGLPFVSATDVKCGSDQADQLVAAFVNFVIARNYAAHHDALDYDLIVPSDTPKAEHPGRIALVSALLCVVTTLQSKMK